MTTFVSTARNWSGSDAGAGVLAAVRAAAGQVRRRLAIRNDRRRLAEMPDHLLADIGISRSEIANATEFGRIRRLGPSYRL